jgi:hypothetical protein
MTRYDIVYKYKQNVKVSYAFHGNKLNVALYGIRHSAPKQITNTATLNVYRAEALGFSQPLTEKSTRNIKLIMFLGSKVQRVRKADNLTAICEPTV